MTPLLILAFVQAGTGRLEFAVEENGRPLPCRIHLFDAAGQTPKLAGFPSWRDHFVCAGAGRLEVPAGKYRYEIERGPEYSAVSGEAEVAAGGERRVAAELKRLWDLKADGWWSGELHVHRPLEDVPLLMGAEDLHVALVITWWNNRNLWAGKDLPKELPARLEGDRFTHPMAGEDEREGGALLYFNLLKPLAITGATREHPSPMAFLAEARKSPGVHVDIEKPFWWDAPVWLASGQVDTIGIANNHMCRSQMLEKEAWGRARNAARLPPPQGNGFWTQEIYYHALNCGLRVPPSAGSASGVLPNPVGYNRAYVKIDGALTYEKWFEGLRAGRSFVTNGPLLRVQADGNWPGHVFASAGPVELELRATLEGRDRAGAVEIIRDGRLDREVAAEALSKTGSLGRLRFEKSGWFLVRAIAENPKTFRFASTAPWYVEIGESKRRVSRASARFFADWVEERIGRVRETDPRKREEVLEHQRRAKAFWEDLVRNADAE